MQNIFNIKSGINQNGKYRINPRREGYFYIMNYDHLNDIPTDELKSICKKEFEELKELVIKERDEIATHLTCLNVSFTKMLELNERMTHNLKTLDRLELIGEKIDKL